MGLGPRRPSVDSGYGGDVEKSMLPAGLDAAVKEMSVPTASNPSTPKKERWVPPVTPPPRPSSATGSLLRRFKSTRLPFRSNIPTAASVFASPPPPMSGHGANEKGVGYSTETMSSPSRSGMSSPSRSGTPVPPLMRKLVAGLLVERRDTF